jgi:hypothetical protein
MGNLEFGVTFMLCLSSDTVSQNHSASHRCSVVQGEQRMTLTQNQASEIGRAPVPEYSMAMVSRSREFGHQKSCQSKAPKYTSPISIKHLPSNHNARWMHSIVSRRDELHFHELSHWRRTLSRNRTQQDTLTECNQNHETI